MRLIVDAEQTWLQPAIDALTINLMRSHNAGPARASAGRTLVLNSYQCYLRDGPARVAADGARAEAEGWTHGAKAVRGAYIVSERMRAAAAGDPDPIWPTIQATHTAYDGTVGRLLDAVAGGRAEVMVASHNQASIEAAVAGMAARGLGPRGAPVYCGQARVSLGSGEWVGGWRRRRASLPPPLAARPWPGPDRPARCPPPPLDSCWAWPTT